MRKLIVSFVALVGLVLANPIFAQTPTPTPTPNTDVCVTFKPTPGNGDDGLVVANPVTYPPTNPADYTSSDSKTPANTSWNISRDNEFGNYNIGVGYFRFHLGFVVPIRSILTRAYLTLDLTNSGTQDSLLVNIDYGDWGPTIGIEDFTNLVSPVAAQNAFPTFDTTLLQSWLLSNIDNIHQGSDVYLRIGISQKANDAAPNGFNDVTYLSSNGATPPSLQVCYVVPSPAATPIIDKSGDSFLHQLP